VQPGLIPAGLSLLLIPFLAASCSVASPEPERRPSSGDASDARDSEATRGREARRASVSTGEAASTDRPDVPKLWHFVGVGVGGARGSEDCGTTAPAAWNPQEGWLAMEPSLRQVRQTFGTGAEIGINIHHPYGVYKDYYAFENPARWNGMIFEQRLVTLERCPHAYKRTNMTPLYGLFAKYDFDFTMAYLGAPRCGEKPEWPQWKPEPSHCEPSVYRAALAGLEGFDCITYDALGHQNEADSPVWDTVIRYTNDNWLLGTESLPPRHMDYVLDYADIVYVSERALLHREKHPDLYPSIEELQERGVAVIVFATHPPRSFKGDQWKWAYDRLLYRLREGRADGVGAHLTHLMKLGYDMRPVADAAFGR